MNKYKVSKELRPYVMAVLLRSFYKCQVSETGGQCFCTTNASSDTFHRIVQRAKCEKVTEETGLFQITKEEKDSYVYVYLLEQAGKTAYQVINDKCYA